MWIVKLALRRPYTFVVMALLILVLGGVSVQQMRTDILPEIDIPVITVIWTYKGMDTEEFEKRITTFSEYATSSNVNDIRKIESQTVNGVAVIKIFFHPGTNIGVAMSQVTSVSQAIRQIMPPSVQPPIILRFIASSVPILQLSLSSATLSEAAVYDYALWQLRTQLSTIQGLTLPAPYGGKERQIMVDLDTRAMQSRGVSAKEIADAVNAYNLAYPTGVARIGSREYPVSLNNTPATAAAFNNIPIKVVNGATVYMRDVAFVRDGYTTQTTIVRRDGQRGALLTILKNGNASTLDIVGQVKAMLPQIRAAAPEGLNIDLLFDQSLFVEAAVEGVVHESIIAGLLTASMILLFLGSWRSTLIVAVSIPLAILSSLVLLFALGHSLNVMTLGGLALAVGILVDDATVEIENIHRNLGLGKALKQAILDGAQQIAGPTFVSTLTICIVFVSVVFLEGPARYLFTPLALAVVFAMGASYLLSRTLVPVMVHYLLPAEVAAHGENPSPQPPPPQGEGEKKRRVWLAPPLRCGEGVGGRGLFGRLHGKFEAAFERLRSGYVGLLAWNLAHRKTVLAAFVVLVASGAALLPFVGQDFFPTVDAGQFRLHVRAPAGTRLEQTEQYFARVRQEIRRIIPGDEVELMIDNIGLPNRSYTLAFGDSSTTGQADGEILVALRPHRRKSTPEYIVVLLAVGAGNLHVDGRRQAEIQNLADKIAERIRGIRGVTDVHVHQVVNVPKKHIEVDQTRALELGLTQQDVAQSVLVALSGSGQVQPNYWVDPNNGISYLVEARTPSYKVDSTQAIETMPLTGASRINPQLLANVASIKDGLAAEVVNHANVQPVYDVYANVQGRDLGGVASEINRVVDEVRSQLSPGNTITMRGQAESMQSAFVRLGVGLVFAAVLVYLLMVVNFQSWLDPFIILTALPGTLVGIVWALLLWKTTFSVPSLMGAIMAIGVATANSILMVTFANEQRGEGKDALEAALEAGRTRMRPVLMTALAMVIGMLPMSLGLGEGGEQNAPLARAVIGGLILATVATLLFVPVVYSVLRRKAIPVTEED